MGNLAMGLETEYALAALTQKGECVISNDAAGYILLPMDKFMHQSFARRPPLVQALKIIEESSGKFWVGVTGGRLYGDAIGGSEVLEYATPECDTIEGVVQAAMGGDRIINLLRSLVFKEHSSGGQSFRELLINKNSSDLIRGGSLEATNFLGSHENYQIGSGLIPIFGAGNFSPKGLFIQSLASLLLARQLLVGAGGLFWDNSSKEWRYIISPRALQVNKILSEDVSRGRPMISWRYTVDFSSSAPALVRLHIPVAESNMLSWALRFRFSLVSLLLAMFAKGEFYESALPLLSDPVEALKIFSLDPSLKVKVDLMGERVQRTLPELLLIWLEILTKFAEHHSLELMEKLAILREAFKVVESLRKDPETLQDKIEWRCKLGLLHKYCARKGINFSHAKTRRFDIYFSDISPGGIYHQWLKLCGEDIFSEAELRMLVWNHKAAPRAELRKKYFSVLAENDLGSANHDWYKFSLAKGKVVGIVDPFIGTEPRIEKAIQGFSNQ